MSRLKVSLRTLVTIFILTITVSSCATDDDNTSQNPDSGLFLAKVNGVDYNPEFKTAFLTSITSTILVSGQMADGEAIQIFIPSTLSVGTYPFAQEDGEFVQAIYQETDADALDGAFASSGSITISTLDSESKKISGTFSFSGTVTNTGEAISVTEGQFDLNWEDI